MSGTMPGKATGLTPPSTLGGRHYANAQAVTARVAAIATGRRVSGYLRTTIGTDPVTGKPALSWHFDDTALTAEAAATWLVLVDRGVDPLSRTPPSCWA